MRTLVRFFAASTLLFAAATLPAQQPEIVHAQLTTQAAAQPIAETIEGLKRQEAPTWIGYTVPVIGTFSGNWGDHQFTYLEGKQNAWKEEDYQEHSYDHALILLRVVDGAVGKVRLDTPERKIDAGGASFLWLNKVDQEDSVRFLTELARTTATHAMRDSAVFTISIHQTASATKALEALTAPTLDLSLRDKAAFWLANQRGYDGLAVIERLTREDANSAFREKLTFDLTLSKDPAALDDLSRMAHIDASPRVRKQAQFWMANKGGRKVSADLRQLAENDPESSARESAVFALSRLPGDEAATQLIAVADSSKDPAVRRQAVFWLGQSNDPKALAYLTKLITAPSAGSKP